MSTNDYVRFVTQQFVSYMDAPKEDRKQKNNAVLKKSHL